MLADGLVEGTSGQHLRPAARRAGVPHAVVGRLRHDDARRPRGRRPRRHRRRRATARPPPRRTCTSRRCARYPELGAVIHTHAVYATMFALAHEPIPAVIEEVVVYIGGDVPVLRVQGHRHRRARRRGGRPPGRPGRGPARQPRPRHLRVDAGEGAAQRRPGRAHRQDRVGRPGDGRDDPPAARQGRTATWPASTASSGTTRDRLFDAAARGGRRGGARRRRCPGAADARGGRLRRAAARPRSTTTRPASGPRPGRGPATGPAGSSSARGSGTPGRERIAELRGGVRAGARRRRRRDDDRAGRPRPRLRGHLRRPGLRRQPGRRRLAAHRLPRAALPAGATATVSDADCDAVIVGSGPGGATVAEVLTAAGLVGGHPREGPQPPARPRRRRTSRCATSPTTRSPLTRRHLLGPDPLLEPRTYRRSTADGDRLLTGEVNNLPSTVGGGGVHADAKLPRFREEDFHLRSRARADRRRDGRRLAARSTTTSSRTTPRSSSSFGVAGEDGANPFAAWRSSPFPMPPGDDMPMAVVSAAAAERAGLHPYRAPTGRQQRPLRRPAGLRRLRVLRRLRLPRPRQGRPDRRPAAGAAHRALRAAPRGLRHRDRRSTAAAGGPPASATSTCTGYPDPPVREVRAARAVVLAGGAFETPRLLLRNGLGGDLVGRFLTYHFQTFTRRHLPRADRRRAGPQRHPPARRPHDRHARAAGRGARPPACRGCAAASVEHGAGPGPIDEAQHLPGRRRATCASMTDSALRRRLWVFTMQGEDLPQADQPRRPRPVGARRLGLPGRSGHLRAAPPRAGGVGLRGAAPRGGACPTPAPRSPSRPRRRRRTTSTGTPTPARSASPRRAAT